MPTPAPSAQIPFPPRMPLLGNLHRITFLETSRAFDGIFEAKFCRQTGVFVTSPDLVAELSDARRFRKVISGGLYFVRTLPPGREDHQAKGWQCDKSA